ncbi:phosphoadenosine phosphosulfate reductase family protein [Alkaliphilus sp. B6464]|uniref:phosphoadenosine phosphosulfate reductase family protein n=1 Tax=Alkaliphilus sp. B6464 TaxID=2731219 RepID=UPI001BA9CE38|nr:phosphoadenosine phosphosulfate reductase family protein [Alkaliphilus sp. B6464]QUH21099.1 phosphoadenosine phosphosulfate reductase family protein [Alkaliphilus sp. B6464]
MLEKAIEKLRKEMDQEKDNAYTQVVGGYLIKFLNKNQGAAERFLAEDKTIAKSLETMKNEASKKKKNNFAMFTLEEGLGQLNIDGKDKIQVAIERLKMFEPPAGYYLAFSGGKDSECIKELAIMAGVKFDAHYNHTTVDPPELVYHIRNNHKDVAIHYPEKSMWKLIEEKLMPPNRSARYCCDVLKEGGGEGRFVVTGVRWAESARRKNTRNVVEFDKYGSQSRKAKQQREIFLMSDNDEKRKMIENCQVKGKHILNPIVDWTEDDVWKFIKLRNIDYCELYDEGFKRLGCIGCPLAGKRNMEKDFERWPIYYTNYIKAFERMLEERDHRGLKTDNWKTGEDVMKWFMNC